MQRKAPRDAPIVMGTTREYARENTRFGRGVAHNLARSREKRPFGSGETGITLRRSPSGLVDRELAARRRCVAVSAKVMARTMHRCMPPRVRRHLGQGQAHELAITKPAIRRRGTTTGVAGEGLGRKGARTASAGLRGSNIQSHADGPPVRPESIGTFTPRCG